jgi:hypothetical protein
LLREDSVDEATNSRGYLTATLRRDETAEISAGWTGGSDLSTGFEGGKGIESTATSAPTTPTNKTHQKQTETISKINALVFARIACIVNIPKPTVDDPQANFE